MQHLPLATDTLRWRTARGVLEYFAGETAAAAIGSTTEGRESSTAPLRARLWSWRP